MTEPPRTPWQDPKLAHALNRSARLMRLDAILQIVVLVPSLLVLLGICGCCGWYAFIR